MKKIISGILVLILLLSIFSGCSSKTDRENTLKIYNWDDYIDLSLLDDFKEYYDAKYGTDLNIIYDAFDTNETMLTKIEKGKEDYDVCAPSDYIIEKMVREDLVIPFDNKIVGENYNTYVPDFIKKQYAEITGNTDQILYSVGYTWGTMGIMYNKEHVDIADLKSMGWDILWNEKYSGMIYMKDSIRDTVCVGNIYVYKDEYLKLQAKFQNKELELDEYMETVQEIFNRTDEKTLAMIEEALIEQKYTVDAMYDIDNDKNAMVNGQAYLNLCWNGDAAWAILEAEELNNGVELGYYIPSEGTNLFFDGWVIPKYAVNTQAANEFVNFMITPKVAVQNMEYIGYTSVVSSPETLEFAQSSAYEDDEAVDVSYFFEGQTNVKTNSAMYPDFSIVASSAIMRDYGEDTENVAFMWTRVKGNALSPAMVIFMVVIGLAIIGLIVFVVVKKAKKKTAKSKKSTNKKKNTYRPE